MQNACTESFYRKFRDECLNEQGFVSLDQAKAEVALWRRHYNDVRPHSSLDQQTPAAFSETLREQALLYPNPSPSDRLKTKDSA